MYYIEIEDLVTNALIELLEKFNKRSITFSLLDSYCNVVVKKLEDNNKKVVTLFSRDTTEAFFHDYTEFFYVNDTSIVLRENIKLEQLKTKFRTNLALDVFLAFISKEAVEILQQVA